MSIEKYIEKFDNLKIFSAPINENGQDVRTFVVDIHEVKSFIRTSLEEYGRERFEAGFKMGLTEDNNLK